MVMQKSVFKKKALDISYGQQVTVYDEYRVNQNIVLRYLSVCTPDFKLFGADANNDVYSALIILSENGVDIETKFIYDIARTDDESYRIMKLLSDNGVTPDTAAEILDELL